MNSSSYRTIRSWVQYTLELSLYSKSCQKGFIPTVMGYFLLYPSIVVSASVSIYLGWRAQSSLILWRYGTINGYTKTKYQDWEADIIIPYPLSFGTSQNLPLWFHIFLVKIYCLNIASSWPKKMTRCSTSFILTLNQSPKLTFSPLFSTIS